MQNQFFQQSSFTLWKRIYPFIWPYRLRILLGLLATALYAGVDAFFLYYLKPILDKGFIAREPSFIAWVPYVILGAFLMRGMMSFISNYTMSWIARHIVMQFRQILFQHFV